MPNDDTAYDEAFAQDFETIEDFKKKTIQQKPDNEESHFLPFFFEDYSGI